MLGKGLESLIPQKGNQGANSVPQNDHASQDGQDNISSGNSNENIVAENSHPQPAEEKKNSAESSNSDRSNAQSRPPRKEEIIQESVFHIEIDKVKPNPDQPRRNFNEEALRELSYSIREFGFLQPLVVSKAEKESPTGIDVEYQIIAGERRYLAAKMLGLRMVPAIIRNVNLEREKLELAVIENIQRENLNPIETARAFQKLQEEFRMTQREIAAKLGKSREVVANSVRLLDLPEYIQTAVQEGKISESHARLLLAVDDPQHQKSLFDDILQNKLTTRDLKERVQHFAGKRGRPPLEEVHLAPEVKALKDSLSMELGAPVDIQKTANNGRITITFYSEEELENILRKLGKE